ncbi:MAG: hypothetical protein K0T00_229 [Gaiellaceae bacterium]|jgi:hypothetical protein|nr:hypothetical protein [Gaiellaceae bacterium]
MLTAAKREPSSEPYVNPGARDAPARGERIYRHVNERIRELERTYDFGEPLQLFCECGCSAAISVDPRRYEAVRVHREQFVVAPGHARPESEAIVERAPDYWIVEER